MRFRTIIDEHKKKMGKIITEINGNFDVLMEQKNTTEASRLFDCNKIELYENHIMIYKRGRLIFKIWLAREDYADLETAMKETGIKLFEF